MYRKQKYNILKTAAIVAGVLFSLLPIWIGFAASTMSLSDIIQGNVGLFKFGNLDNYIEITRQNIQGLPVTAVQLFWNSFFLAIVVTLGKLLISVFSAYAIVFFRIPFENFFFWLIFVTLMLPVEIRCKSAFQNKTQQNIKK